MSAIRAVSWDVDGTLYSLGRLRLSLAGIAVRGLFTGWGLGPARELRRLAVHYATINRGRRAGEPFRPPPDRESMLRIEAKWVGKALLRIGPRPGLVTALDAVAARGLPQVVASDYEAGHKVSALGLADRFVALHAGECLGALKPGPAVFLAAAAGLGIEPAALLHIGDRDDRDGAGARAAGCQVAILGRELRRLEDLALLIGG